MGKAGRKTVPWDRAIESARAKERETRKEIEAHHRVWISRVHAFSAYLAR